MENLIEQTTVIDDENLFYQIEENVEVPRTIRNRNSKYDILLKLKNKQSVLLPRNDKNTYSQTSTIRAFLRTKLGEEYKSRTYIMSEVLVPSKPGLKAVRVWRTK